MAAIIFGISFGLILYTYLGYPAFLAFFARLWQQPVRKEEQTPSVTLLIAAYNEEDTIGQKIENSLALDYPAEYLQILVAADGSQDRTVEIVAAFADKGVDLAYEPARHGKMAAINCAMPRARGDIVVFSDANNFYSPGTLRELVKPFADQQIGAASGAKVIAPGDGALGDTEGLYWRYESFIRQKETELGSTVGVIGEVLAIRRELFEPPPDTIINDDFYIALRLLQRGHRVVYVPQARSVERISPSAGDEVARRTRIVAGRYQAIIRSSELLPWKRPLLVWQILSHKYLRTIIPILMMIALLANLVWAVQTSGLGKPAHLLLLSQVLFYVLAGLGSLIPLKGNLGKALYLPTFLVNSNFAALAGLFRFLARKQSATWQRVPRQSIRSISGKE